MEHSRIVSKDKGISNLYINIEETATVSYRKYKVNNDDTWIELAPDALTYKNKFWTSPVTIPNEDCYIVMVVNINGDDMDFIVVRVGEPVMKVFHYKPNSPIAPAYVQYDSSGVLLTDGMFNYITHGVSYYIPTELEESLFFIDNVMKVMKVPYLIVPVTQPGDTVTSDKLFLDTGFSTYGFLGTKKSHFINGNWVKDDSVTAKASDLAKAVAHKYDLEWADRTASNHIYNYIQYFRTYDEEAKVFRFYAPSITPEDSLSNFQLVVEDELGNPFIKGISMLLVQQLEVINEGSAGVIVPFQ